MQNYVAFTLCILHSAMCASHRMRLCRYASRLLYIIARKPEFVTPSSFAPGSLVLAAEALKQSRWLHFTSTLGLRAMASSPARDGIPYPTLPEKFADDLKDEEGAMMSKRYLSGILFLYQRLVLLGALI